MLETIYNNILAILFTGGGAFILISYFIARKKNDTSLKDRGEMTEGVVFNLARHPSNGSDYDSADVMDKVTIRFLTKNNQWITTEITQTLAVFYTDQYKIGDKVELYYDPNNPKNIYVTTKQSGSTNLLLLVGISIVFMSIGLYLLLN